MVAKESAHSLQIRYLNKDEIDIGRKFWQGATIEDMHKIEGKRN